jgi:RNA recognition motif-containing protein
MNWADHCSSDEESDEGYTHPARTSTDIDHDISYDDSANEQKLKDENLELEEEVIPFPPPLDFSVLPENMPTEAPYTGYLRNLSYKINSPDYLRDVVERLIQERYEGQQTVKVTEARIGLDRDTKKRLGYGDVEFNNARELMIFINLNDGHSKIMGRTITIDIARATKKRTGNSRNNRNRGGDIDGSQFRGGIKKTNTSDGKQRTSLKLAPRSVATGDDHGNETRSSIFGSAKPANDISHWESSKEKQQRSSDTDRMTGRHRGAGDKKPNNTSNNRGRGKGKRDNVGKSEEGPDGFKAAPAVGVTKVPVVQVGEKKPVVKVQNAFSALGFDSDSD